MEPLSIYLLFLVIVGLLLTGRLLWSHTNLPWFQSPKKYPNTGVTDTKWAYLLGVKNEIIGVGYYLIMLLFALFFTQNPLAVRLFFLGSIVAFLSSLFLIYIQAKILHKYCLFCLLSSLVNTLVVASIVCELFFF